MKPTHIIVMTTFSKPETGEKIASKLLNEKLAACIQAFPVSSSYTWKGEICKDAETLLLIKTKADHYEAVEKAIRSVHDYETPEIIATPVLFGSEAYLSWMNEVTK
jgi:periplasmic divalent cation tolerance protein